MRQDSPKVWSEPSFETSTKTFQNKISLIDIKQSWLLFSKTDCAMTLWWLITWTSPSLVTEERKKWSIIESEYLLFFFSQVPLVMLCWKLTVDDTASIDEWLMCCIRFCRSVASDHVQLLYTQVYKFDNYLIEFKKQSCIGDVKAAMVNLVFRAPSSLFLAFFFSFFLIDLTIHISSD